MKLKYYWNLLRGKTKALNPAKLTFRNIYAVIQSIFRRSIQGFSIQTHIYEQAVWRWTQVMLKSPQCWEEGNCIHCGCEMLGKTIEDRGCENEPRGYPDMMGKKEGKQFKLSNNIKIFE